MYQASARRCVEAALVNGAVRVLGLKRGMAIERQLFRAKGGSRQSITSLRRVQDILHACNKAVEGKLGVKTISGNDKSSFRSNAFQWLAEDAKGVWIVRLVENGVCDHCAVVDTTVALIFDCATEHPISLTEETFRLCGGDDARHLRVAEVRLLVPQKTKTKTRKPKRARLE